MEVAGEKFLAEFGAPAIPAGRVSSGAALTLVLKWNDVGLKIAMLGGGYTLQQARATRFSITNDCEPRL